MDVVRTAISYITFRRFYRYLLKRFLGKLIVPDFSLEQLDVELYKGVVQLTDAVVNATSLNSWLRGKGIPLLIKSGSVAKLRVRIPWRNILHDNCKLYVSELDLRISVSAQGWLGGLGDPEGNSTSSSSEIPTTVEALTHLVEEVLMNVEGCVDKIVVHVEGEHDIKFETSNIVIESNSMVTKNCRIGETEVHIVTRMGKSRLLRLSPVSLTLKLESPEVAALGIHTDSVSVSVDRKQTFISLLQLIERWKRVFTASRDDSCMYQSVMEGDAAPVSDATDEKPWYEEIYSVIEKEVAKGTEYEIAQSITSEGKLEFHGIDLSPDTIERRLELTGKVGTVFLSLFERDRETPSVSLFLYGVNASSFSVSVADYAVHFVPVRLSSDAMDMFLSMMSNHDASEVDADSASSVYESVGDDDDESLANSIVGDADQSSDSESVHAPAVASTTESEQSIERESIFFSESGAGALRAIDVQEYSKVYRGIDPWGDIILRPTVRGNLDAINVNFLPESVSAAVQGGITVSLTPEWIANSSVLSQVISLCIEEAGFRDDLSPKSDKRTAHFRVSVSEGLQIKILLGNGHSLGIASEGGLVFDSMSGGSVPNLSVETGPAVTAAEIDSVGFWIERDTRTVVEEPVAMTASVHSSKSGQSSNSRRTDDDRFGSAWTAVTSRHQKDSKKEKPKHQPLPANNKPVVTEKSLAEASAEIVGERCKQQGLTEIIFCAKKISVCEDAINFLDLQLKIQSLVDQISLITVALQESLGFRPGPGLLTPRSLLAQASRPAIGLSVFVSHVTVHSVALADVSVRTVLVSGQPLLKVSVRDCQVTTPDGSAVCEPWQKFSSSPVPDNVSYESLVGPRFADGSQKDVVTVTVQVSSIPGEEQTTSRICLGVTVAGLRVAFEPSLIEFFKSLMSFFAPPVALVNHTAPLLTAPPRPTYTVYIFRINRTVVGWKNITPPVPGTESLVAAAAVVLDGVETSSGVLSTVDKKTAAGLSILLGNVSCWFAKNVWAESDMRRADISKALTEMGYVPVINLARAGGTYKFKGRELCSLALNLGLLRVDFRADSYAGLGCFAKTCETVFQSLKPSSDEDEDETISMPPLAQPKPATFTIREDFVQSKTALKGGRGGSRWSRPAAEILKPEPSSEMGARWLVDPKQVSVVHDHWSSVGLTGSQSRNSVVNAAESRIRASNGLLSMLSVSLSVDQVRLFLHGGFDWEGTEFHLAGLLRRRKRKSTTVIQPQSLVCVELDKVALTIVTVKPRSEKVADQVSPDDLTSELSLTLGEVRMKDGVVGSAYQYVLSPLVGERAALRPNNSGGHVSVNYSSVGTVRKGQVSVLPLCLTLDQDTLEFLSKFVQQTSLLAYRADETVELDLSSDEDSVHGETEQGPSTETPEQQVSEELSEEHAGVSDPAESSSRRTTEGGIDVLFQSLQISPMQLEINYRSKRLSISGLRRGDPLQLLNLVPVLEGLQVALSEIKMVDVLDKSDVIGRLTRSWSKDINKAQILRSLSGVTPLRSFTNLSVGVTDLIKQPLKQIKRKDGHLSRGLLRGISSFLRILTIESLNLADVVVSSAQTALEFVDSLATARDPSADLEQIECVWEDSDGVDSTAGDTPAYEWTAVERGARERLMDPASAVEGFRTGGDALVRGLKSGLRQSPTVEGSGVIVSMAKGAPGFILRPAIGAAQAVSVVLRGARSTVDSGRKRAEVERRYKAPYTQDDLTR